MSTQHALDQMPHKGAMLLIDHIVCVTETQIECVGTPHGAPAYPLRIDGVLFPASLVELGAQAAAAHASLHTVKGAHEGLLVGLQNTEIHQGKAVVGTGNLNISADQIYLDRSGMIYQFTVRIEDENIISGRVVLKVHGS